MQYVSFSISYRTLLWTHEDEGINQNDDVEREQQVQMMRDIYRCASITVIWLGEETIDTSGWAESLHALQKKVPNPFFNWEMFDSS